MVSSILPKNEWKNEKIQLNSTMIPQVELFLFVFLEEKRIPKSPFEINWPLEHKHIFYSTLCTYNFAVSEPLASFTKLLPAPRKKKQFTLAVLLAALLLVEIFSGTFQKMVIFKLTIRSLASSPLLGLSEWLGSSVSTIKMHFFHIFTVRVRNIKREE